MKQETENMERRISEPGRLSAPWQGKINLMGDFGGYLVIREGGNKTDNTLGDFHGNGCQIRVSKRRHIGKMVHSAPQRTARSFKPHRERALKKL